MTDMKRRRNSPEQAIRKLREGERRLNAGEELGLVLRQLEITESTWNRWRSTYGGMKAADAKELKELRVENARLKKLLAETESGQGDAQGARGGKMVTRTADGLLWCGSWIGSGCQSVVRVVWWASIVRPSGGRRLCALMPMPSMGRGCASSRSLIPAGGGARLTTSPLGKAV